jgi:hypothetical protein
MPESRLGMLRADLHPLISVLLPFSFLQAFDAVIRLGIFESLMPVPPPVFLLVVLAAGASQTLISNFLGSRRIAGVLPRIREFILTLAAADVLLALLHGGPFRGDWNPLTLNVLWPLLLCVMQWLLTLYAQNLFRSRELYLRLLGGASGHALIRAARQAAGEAAEAQETLRKLIVTAVALEVCVVVLFALLLGARVIAGIPAPPEMVTVRVLIHVVLCTACIVVLRLFSHEQTISAAGVDPASSGGLRRIAGSLAGVGTVFLAGLLLSGRAALLPLSALTNFFTWLSNLLPRGGNGNFIPPRLDTLPQGPDIQGVSNMELPPVSESELLARIFRILGIVAAAAAAAALLYFIIRPLLSRDARRMAGQIHPLRGLLRRLRAIARMLALLPGALSRRLRAPGKGFASVPRAILDSLRESIPGRKGRQVQDRARRKSQDRAVRDFQRLARWGRKAGVIFTPVEGPADYVRRLELSAPTKGPVLREAARLFEELVYADALPARGEGALARLVDGIVK